MTDKQNQKQFLLELAALTEKYKVAICSENVKNYSQVFFIFENPKGSKVLDTNRLHSSPYELRVIAKRLDHDTT